MNELRPADDTGSRQVPLDQNNMNDAECYVNISRNGHMTLITYFEGEVIPISNKRIGDIYKTMTDYIERGQCPICHSNLFNTVLLSYPPKYKSECKTCGFEL